MIPELNANTLITLLLLLVALASFAIGISIYRHDKTKRSTRYFGIVGIAAGFWVLGRAFLQLSSVTGLAPVWGYYLFIPPIVMALFLFLFAFYIGRENRVISPLQKIFIFGPWIALLLFTLSPGATARDVVFQGGQNVVVYGPLFFKVYLPLLAVYLFGMFPILIYKYSRVSNDLRIRLRYIIFGTFFSITVAVTANLFLPLFGVTNVVWLGPLVAIVLLMIVGYAITRRELWDFKLVITEIVVVAVLLTLLVDIFVAADVLSKVIFKSIAFIFTAIFSYLLIRGIFKEVEAREDVRELTEELERANIRLKEIDVEKSTFVSIASHQLRTPLTVIKGYAAMLLEGTFGPIENKEAKKVIRNIFDASERLVGMIEDFLNISRIEQGKMSYKFTRIEVATLLWSVVNELKAASPEVGERLKIHIGEGQQYPVIGDALKLRQVINNLIDNAIKYSPKGTDIEVALKKRDHKVYLSVKDHGIGISKEAQEKLFQKYTRTESAEKLRKEGRGLGLYVARQIVRAHGGKIWVESKGEGAGSTFHLELAEFVARHRVEIPETVTEISTR
ncbi:hypothetical protein CL654_02430 [bacterium]|nr:hypothetical protein [bacterium]|tara:strand:- start:5601 stop:7286 length:1686 start_codon:yes stop_codon:yes gene_type:complete